MTQFSNAETRQHYFNRLSHLLVLPLLFPLPFHLCLLSFWIYKVIIQYFLWSMASMLYIRHSWTFCECNWSINVTNQNIIMPTDVWRVGKSLKIYFFLVPCHFILELQKGRTEPDERQGQFEVWQYSSPITLPATWLSVYSFLLFFASLLNLISRERRANSSNSALGHSLPLRRTCLRVAWG